MRENKVKSVLKRGGVALGTAVFEFNTTGIARIMAQAGAEFAMFDMEHTGWSMETVRMLMATARAADLVPLVRVPMLQYHFLSRALDVGAMGLVVPMVANEEQARLIVQCAKYPPMGRRGAAFGVAHDDYQDGSIPEKMQSANQEQLLSALLETVEGVENVERIAQVEGIDVLGIGHNDMTVSMGIPGQFDHPRFVSAVDRIIEAANRYGKAVGINVATPEEGARALARGFRFLMYSLDMVIYKNALRQGIDTIRASLPPGPA